MPNEEEIAAAQSYAELLAVIKRNMDPTSNTALIVDDEKGIRMKVVRDVKMFDPNIVIFEAQNGQEALKKLAEIRQKYLRDPLFIVLDLNMPVMDGWKVIDALKKEYEGRGKTSGIPIIILSSTSGEKNVALILKKSVHDGKSGYTPLVTIAKETCIDKSHYDEVGEKGLIRWLEYFVRQ